MKRRDSQRAMLPSYYEMSSEAIWDRAKQQRQVLDMHRDRCLYIHTREEMRESTAHLRSVPSPVHGLMTRRHGDTVETSLTTV